MTAKTNANKSHPINIYDKYFKKDQKNELIIQKFTELLEAIEAERLMADSKDEKRRHDFRLYSIRRGLSKIRQIPEPIMHGESLAHLHGIGDGIVNRINEIIITGDLSELKEITTNPTVKILLDLKSVHGLGEVLAKKLYQEHNVRSVLELRIRTDTYNYLERSDKSMLEDYDKNILSEHSDKFDKIDKNLEKLPEVILSSPEHNKNIKIQKYLKKPKIEVSPIVRLGLLYYDDIGKRIPRQEIADTYEIIKEILFKKDSRIISECCGSYRRGKETSGDIDIIISHPDIITENDLILNGGSVLSYLLNELQKLGKLEVTLNAGLGRFQGLIRTANNYVRRSDIFWVPYDSYFSGLNYLTGSDIFNRLARCIAHRKGYTMSNWGLYPFQDPTDTNLRKIKRNKNEEPDINWETMRTDPHAPSKYLTHSKIPLRSEEEIFKILGIEWLPPNKRT